ncbi:hypothetical protein FHX81_7277 [Saccharothrix saharensis]|uniref:Uncharacterized protein n=1 Tax=Saccharothrix saharensis TaxID=571190 RepID=A0A543JPT6_9PSEU|nr:hypothetical protein [Saccharothrix saharensis]TQM84818.1 hypothetical protein FHX81_7277 [Saccharothrix saharensis]
MIDYRVPLQIAVLWIAVGVTATAVGWLVLFGFLVESAGLVGVGMLGPFVVVYLVGTLIPAGSPWTATPLRRVGWAALVTVLGLVGIVFHHAVVEASTPAEPPTWLVLPAVGIPFALVAAMLAHGLVVRLAAVAVTVAAVAFGLWFPTTMPADDTASRIRNAGPPGGVLLVATPEGYHHPSLRIEDDRAIYRFTPVDPAVRPGAVPRLVVRPATVEGTEPVHRVDGAEHVVVRRIGDVEAVAVVSDAADVAVAREWVRSVRPATDEEVELLLPAAPGRRDRDVLRPFADAWARLF